MHVLRDCKISDTPSDVGNESRISSMCSNSEVIDEKAKLLSAFANAKRVLILEILLENEYRVGDLAKEVCLSQSALSQHLALLRENGLVTSRRDAQTVYYTTTDERVRAVLGALRVVYREPIRLAARL